MQKDIIIALDFPSAKTALDFLAKFGDVRKPMVKIGMELFYSEGPSIVREIKKLGHGVFLDLKLHDIPNTVKRSMAALADLGADIVNLHVAGGSEMMKYALEGLTRKDGSRPLLIGVTQLTSTSPEMLRNELLIETPMAETVKMYARNAADCGLDGVVCSPLEAKVVKECCGEAFLTVTPGIRFAGGDVGDQKRIMTPAAAKNAGCDLLVMGRPVTQAPDPVAAYMQAVADFL